MLINNKEFIFDILYIIGVNIFLYLVISHYLPSDESRLGLVLVLIMLNSTILYICAVRRKTDVN